MQVRIRAMGECVRFWDASGVGYELRYSVPIDY